jgi:hypothetical protein
MVTQAALLWADQEHPDLVRTPTVPLPPDASKAALPDVSWYVHSGGAGPGGGGDGGGGAGDGGGGGGVWVRAS